MFGFSLKISNEHFGDMILHLCHPACFNMRMVQELRRSMDMGVLREYYGVEFTTGCYTLSTIGKIESGWQVYCSPVGWHAS